MNTEKSCGAVVFTRENDQIMYVIIQSTEGFFGFPKGHIEPGESERETALREIKEETGLNVVLLDGFKTTDEHPHARPGRPTVLKQMIYFLAEYKDQTPCAQETEVSSIHQMRYEDASNAFQFESSRRILREAHEYLMTHS